MVQQVDLGTRFLAYQENAAMWLDPEEQKVGGDFSYLNVLATFFLCLLPAKWSRLDLNGHMCIICH